MLNAQCSMLKCSATSILIFAPCSVSRAGISNQGQKSPVWKKRILYLVTCILELKAEDRERKIDYWVVWVVPELFIIYLHDACRVSRLCFDLLECTTPIAIT